MASRERRLLDKCLQECNDDLGAVVKIIINSGRGMPPQAGRKIPVGKYVPLLLERFGTAATTWAGEPIDQLITHLCSSWRYWDALTMFVTEVDGACFTFHHVIQIFGPMQSRIANFPRQLLRAIPSEEFTHTESLKEVIRLCMGMNSWWHVGDPTLSIFLERIPSDILFAIPEGDDVSIFHTLTHDCGSYLRAVSRLPKSKYGTVPVDTARIEHIIVNFERPQYPPFNVDDVDRLANVASPTSRLEIHRYLNGRLLDFRTFLAQFEERWNRLYPGQTVDNHECPPASEDHVCVKGEGPNTCPRCCDNCMPRPMSTSISITRCKKDIAGIEALLEHFDVSPPVKSAAQ